MPKSSRNSFADLERHRLLLEQNVAKLRASLQHWQAWEIEYEGLKEDIVGLDEDDSHRTLEDLEIDTGCSMFPTQKNLLTSKERFRLIRDERGNLRGNEQILGLLSHRIEYVQQNVKTVSSLLNTAEEKYAASQVLSRPEVRNDEGLPLTEILEELDEEGNIVSCSTSEPGQATPQVVEALRKAGIKELPEHNKVEDLPDEIIDEKPESNVIDNAPNTPGQKSDKDKELTSSLSRPTAKSKAKKSSRPRKSVSFAEDTKAEHVPNGLPQSTNTTNGHDQQAKKIKPISNKKLPNRPNPSQKPNITLYDEDEDKPFQAVVPENESPEDAELRQQMIQYNMSEVGAIVAELDLDEDEASLSDEGSEGEYLDDGSVDEDEDEYGRNKRRVLKDSYVAEMRKLEQRLRNMGPDGVIAASTVVNDIKGAQPPSRTNMGNGDTPSPEDLPTKGVRFAKELDIQEAAPRLPPTVPASSPVPTEATDMPRKPIHAPKVIERPYTSSTSPSWITEPDEFDPSLLRQEVSTEYHRMRNHMIQRQGGFTNSEDADEEGRVPLAEAEGGRKKVSRFKAARLGKVSQ